MVREILFKILSRIYGFYTSGNSNEITNLGYFCTTIVTSIVFTFYIVGFSSSLKLLKNNCFAPN